MAALAMGARRVVSSVERFIAMIVLAGLRDYVISRRVLGLGSDGITSAWHYLFGAAVWGAPVTWRSGEWDR